MEPRFVSGELAEKIHFFITFGLIIALVVMNDLRRDWKKRCKQLEKELLEAKWLKPSK